MNILILHGPNTNLIGSVSAKNGDQITLSKIDSKISNTDITLSSLANRIIDKNGIDAVLKDMRSKGQKI